MAIPTVNQIYGITFKGTFCNQIVLSTFKYRLSLLGPAVSVADVYAVIAANLAIITSIKGRFLDVTPMNYHMDEHWIQALYPERIALLRTTVNLPGNIQVVAPSSNLTAVITRRAETANRMSVGSLHVPLVTSAAFTIDGVIVDAAFKQKLQLLADEMKKQMKGNGDPATTLDPVIWGSPKAQPGIGKLINQTFVQPQVRTQRRRTVGLGI